MRLTQSLQSRLLLGAGVWSLVALIVTWLLLSYLMRTQLETQAHHKLSADLNQLLAQVEGQADGGLRPGVQLSDPLYQRVYSGNYWQISSTPPAGSKMITRSRSLWDQDLLLAETNTNADSFRHVSGPRGESLLALVRTVTLPRVTGPVQLQVTTNLAEVEAAMDQFRLVLALGLLALALGLLMAVFVQIRLGLAPLRRMRRGLADIRDGVSQHLAGEYPAEVQPLVEDLNAVLNDNETLIERARSRAGNLAHALKTPLSVLANEADAQTHQGNFDLGERLLLETQTMQARIDWHLAHARIAARQRPGAHTQVKPVLERLQRTLAKLYPEREITHHVSVDVAFRGETQDLEQMLGNLMDNACKWAKRVVQVTITQDQNKISIAVNDDGQGLSPAARELALGRGRRLDEAKPGDGLGLSIVYELAELYGGALILVESPGGGLSARLELPAHQSGMPR